MSKDLDAIKEHFGSGEYVKFKIESCILSWARHLATPDTEFDAVGKYKVTCTIGPDIANDMKYIGFNVKEKDGEVFVVPTRQPALGAPKVVDTDGNPVDPTTIGNGTVATVECTARSVKVAGKTHLPIYIEKVIVEDLVTYEGTGEGESISFSS